MGLNIQGWLCCDSTPVIIPEPCISSCPNPTESIMSGVPGIGIADGDWTVTPQGTTTTTQAIGTGFSRYRTGHRRFAGTNWISLDNSSQAATGSYIFEHQFTIDPNCQNPTLTLCVQVDELCVFSMNGIGVSNFIHSGSITITAPFPFRNGYQYPYFQGN